MDVRGRGVIVTGGSRGLGAALGRALARRGARVALVARSREPLEAVAAGLRAEGLEAHTLPFDVGEKRDAHAIAFAAAGLVGDVDLLVHAASDLGDVPLRPLLETDCETLARVFETNVVGPFRLTKLVAGSMLLRREGLVVQISSDAASGAYPGWGPYGASKAAGDLLARTLAAELPEPRVFVVDPGEMDTRMHADAVPDADRSKLARPEAVAEALAVLVAEAERHPSGARFVVGRRGTGPRLEALREGESAREGDGPRAPATEVRA